MGKTQLQLITAVRERLDEPVEGQWTDREIRRWINDAAKDMCRRCEILQTRANIDITADTREYTMPDDVIRVYRATYTADGDTSVYPLEYRDFNNMDAVWWTQQAVTTSTPHLFTMWGYPPALKLILYPIPSIDGTVELFYYSLPTELATDTTADNGTTLGIPEGWDDPIIDFVEYMALRKDRDPRWQEAKALYEEHVGALYDLSRRWSDQAGMVTPETPLLPSWLYEG